MRRNIRQQAGSIAHSGLERLLGRPGESPLGRIGRALDHLHLAAGGGHLRLREQQPGTGLDQVSGKRRDPPPNRRRFAAQIEDLVEVLLDQPGGPAHLPGGHRVPDRIISQPVLLVPGRRVSVQLRRPNRLFLLQPRAEQVSEKVMVAPPAAHLIQRQQEQARPLHPLKQRLAACPASDLIAQLPRQPLQHRGFHQENAHLLALLLQHLLGQVVQHVAVATGERRHERGDIRPAAQRQGGQLQPGCPPLGPRRQRCHRRIRQTHTGTSRHLLLQERRRFVRGKPQLVGAQLGQLPAGPQPGQRQRRVGPAGQHQVQPRRPVL